MGAERTYTPRINSGGNFCGHDPQNPSLCLPEPPVEKFPSVLVKLMERLQRYYANPRYWLPSLEAANLSKRQQRSERREALVLLLCAILKHTELSSLRCGIPTPQGFVPLDMNYLAGVAGLNPTRATRAMHDLRRSGLISTHQARFLNDAGEYRGYPAVRKVNPLLFHIFGLAHMLKRARKSAANRIKRIAKKVTNAAKSSANVLKLKLSLDAANASSPTTQQGRRPSLANEFKRANFSPHDEERNRLRARIFVEVAEEYPDWDSDRLKAEMERRLQAR